ncbi:MAG: F0F1 ATP synthase subunit delta, partial [Clostridiales bacterium]|nr:F0F1 ATP synthase subunit delta [Clostridiales bacterium]
MSNIVIQVSSATELKDEQKRKLQQVFCAKHKGESVEFVYTIDKELIGGILVVDGDKYYDGTLRSQIDNIGSVFRHSDSYVEAATPKRRKKNNHKQSVADDYDETLGSDGVTAEYIKTRTDSELARKVAHYKKSFDARQAGSVEFCGDGVIMC